LEKRESRKSLEVFFNTLFAEALKNIEGNFVSGEHFNEWCNRYQNQLLTATLSARLHGKSTIVYAFLCWKLYNIESLPGLFPEVIYISYNDDLAGVHVRNIKRLIEQMPCFAEYENLSDAETILKMRKGSKTFTIKPAGIFSFKRGVHTIGVICDDILQDPQKPMMDIGQITKVTRIFNEQIASIKKLEGFLHVTGTAQDKEDLFFTLKNNPKYDWKMYPAIKSKSKKEVLWKEMFPLSKLLEMQYEVETKAFSKEYQCVPVRGVEGFFSEEAIDKLVSKSYNVNWRTYETSNPLFAGMDLGKKMHPSHVAVFEAVPIKDEEGNETEKVTAVQRLSLFLDKMDYNKQKDLVCEMIEKMQIQSFLFDNTRAEFESFIENNELPAECEPTVMTGKEKQILASAFDIFVTCENISFVNDDRQKRQILAVDNNLDAPSTFEGHGDAFWSCALALKKMREGMPSLRWLGKK
jgi:hypothetical protein